jgi:hypothetical protein
LLRFEQLQRLLAQPNLDMSELDFALAVAFARGVGHDPLPPSVSVCVDALLKAGADPRVLQIVERDPKSYGFFAEADDARRNLAAEKLRLHIGQAMGDVGLPKSGTPTGGMSL